jgi:hypothetical protein
MDASKKKKHIKVIPMIILRATSILERQKEDKEMICSITLN